MSKPASWFLVAFVGAMGMISSASAQTSAGVHLGFDTEFTALVLGGETRFPVERIEDFPLVGNPSFEYYLIDRYPGLAETMAGINANAYYEFPVDERDHLEPYTGAGLGLRYYTVEETGGFDPPGEGLDVIVNLLGGATYDLEDSLTPFGHLRLSLGGGTSTVSFTAGLLLDL
jgi:hypothetical protein